MARERLELICLCCEPAFLRDVELINWGAREDAVCVWKWEFSRKSVY